MVDLPRTQRHSARRGRVVPTRLPRCGGAHYRPSLSRPQPALAHHRPQCGMPMSEEAERGGGHRAHQRAEVEKRDLGPVGSVPMTTVARQGNTQRCACTSPCVCSKGCKTVIIERPYEILELRTAQAQCCPAAGGRLWRKTWPRGVPRVRPGWRGHRSPPSGTRPHQRGAPRGTGPDSHQRHEDQTQPCGLSSPRRSSNFDPKRAEGDMRPQGHEDPPDQATTRSGPLTL